MSDDAVTGPDLLGALAPQPPDPILALIDLHARDPRSDKIDLGVGVYRDASGNTPVFAAVKEAERILTATEQTKTYLGSGGNVGFTAAVAQLLLGEELYDRLPLARIQTPGGTGALRLAAELIVRAREGARLWLGTPAYPNHAPIFSAARLPVASLPYFDVTRQEIDFAGMCAALGAARAGDVVLIHGSCHNPTGADLTIEQWQALTQLLLSRGLVPLIDMAYHGLGRGLEEDAQGPRHLLAHAPEALVAYSCSKTFGLYRERTGALLVRLRAPSRQEAVASNLAALARVNWSLPPDHGAELTRIILESAELRLRWQAELTAMRERIQELRQALAAAHPLLGSVGRQAGLFSMLPLSPAQVLGLRQTHSIYMTSNGRMNVAGIDRSQVSRFAAAVGTIVAGG